MDAVDVAQQYGIPPQATGSNSFLPTTRSQGFLGPPCPHRAFPLVDLRPLALSRELGEEERFPAEEAEKRSNTTRDAAR